MGNTVFFSHNNNNNNNNNSSSSSSYLLPSPYLPPYHHHQHQQQQQNRQQNKEQKETSLCLLENHLKLSEPQLLRLKILNDIPINFPFYTIILLYAPPEFNLFNIAEFIGNKVNLPVINLHDLFVRIFNDNDDNNNLSSIKGQDKQQNNCQKKIFESRVMESDCDHGFVIFNYPQTPLQLRHLREFLPQAKLLPIFLDLDNEAMRVLRNKFDRWVHEPSERSYHVLSKPPSSLEGKQFAPTSFNMFDNETGELLVQLKNDTIEEYKLKILDYRKQETLMISCYEEDVYIIPSCYSKPELHRQVIKCLARAMTTLSIQNEQLLTEQVAADVTLKDCSVENIRKFRRNKSLGQGQRSSSL